MKTSSVLFAATALTMASAALAEDINIKGLHIGMPRSDVAALGVPYDWTQMSANGRADGKMTLTQIDGDGLLYGLTIGGVSAIRNVTYLSWRDARLSQASFSFARTSYPLVRAAVLSKYPRLACHDYIPAMSGKPGQPETKEEPAGCYMRQSNASLFISQSVDHGNGVLMLTEIISKEEMKKAAGDI